MAKRVPPAALTWQFKGLTGLGGPRYKATGCKGKMAKALDGVTVIEFASHLGAAYAGMVMAEHGARTIRVEPPGGDPSRGTPHFHALNRSKQPVYLDLESTDGLDRARDLLVLADVVISGFISSCQRAFKRGPRNQSARGDTGNAANGQQGSAGGTGRRK